MTNNVYSRAEATNLLRQELPVLFPNTMPRIMERTYIGETFVTVVYTHYKTKEECSSGILENDPAFMHFTIWSERDGTYYIEHPTTHCGRVFDDKTVKFRKIKAKTQLEAAQKLVKWFEKNREHIIKVGEEYHKNRNT